MVNNNNSGFNQDESSQSESISTHQSTSTLKSDAFSMMKNFGRKGLAPIVEVITKYKDDLNPYLSSVNKGLNAAMDSLHQESASESDKVVGKWFSEASQWINSTSERVRTSNSSDLLQFLEDEARNRPMVMFSASYVAGLVFGRLGRHVSSHSSTSASEIQTPREFQTPPEFQDRPNIH